MAQAAFDEAIATKVPPERLGQAWWLSRDNKPMDSITIYVPATELTQPEPRRSVVIKRRWLAGSPCGRPPL